MNGGVPVKCLRNLEKPLREGKVKSRIVFKKPGSRKPLSLLVIACMLVQFIFFPVTSKAWEQPEHEAINDEAVNKAKKIYSGSPKFKNAPIDWSAKYIGPYTSSSSLLVTGTGIEEINESYKVIPATNTILQWIRHGGFSADEPNLYASVRHFYDPKAAAGVHELTDHSTIHGRYDGAVSALDWAFTHTDNPFNFKNALLYYKKSMEISEDGSPPKDIPQTNGNFRDMEYSPASKNIERNYYLGKAFRALGETMHMISDMAMPAHVRNDSHPTGNLDPIEANMKPYMIRSAAGYEPLPGVSFDDTPADNFKSLAMFTNENFFSNDTIHDKDKGIKPGNGEPPYDRPRLSDFVRDDKYGFPVLFKKVPFNRIYGDVPMVRESLATKIFGQEIIGAGYSIPYYFAGDYADLLAPLAIKASYRLFYDFFPTFNLTLTASEESPSMDEEELGVRRKFRLSCELLHDVSKDPVWMEYSLQVRYSGPAELMKQSGSRKIKIADVIFDQGKMTKIKIAGTENEFKTVDEPVVLYVWDSEKKAVKPEDFPEELDIKDFLIDNDESVYVEVNAGGRNITGNAFVYKEEEIKLEFEKDEYEGVTFTPTSFKAIATNAPRNVKYVWDFGDETSSGNTSKPEAEHRYEEEDNYTVTVKMVDKRNNSVLAEASTAAPISNFFGTWSITYTITDSKGVDTIINMFVKALISLFARIFGEDVNTDEVDVSIKGTEITCSLEIYPPPEDNPKGPITVKLTQLKSSNDIVEPSEEPWPGVVTTKGDNLIFKFHEISGVSAITFKGKLDKTNIEGTFNATVFSGTFTGYKE